jgi:hypothetical protein
MEDDFSDDDGHIPGETRQARRNKKKRSRKERREYKERLELTALPWKKVKVEERVRFQEGGLFSLEELHYEGDVKDADFMHKLLAATPATHLSDSEKAGFKYYGDDEVPSDDEEAADGSFRNQLRLPMPVTILFIPSSLNKYFSLIVLDAFMEDLGF